MFKRKVNIILILLLAIQGPALADTILLQEAVNMDKVKAAHEKTDRIVVTYFNVGQGLCQLITYDKFVILSDCGTASGLSVYGPVANDVGAVIDHLMKKNTARTLYVFISHLDKDHYNLIERVISKIDPSRLDRFGAIAHYNLDELKKIETLRFAKDVGGKDSYSKYSVAARGLVRGLKSSDSRFKVRVLAVNDGGDGGKNKNRRSIVFVVGDDTTKTILMSTGDMNYQTAGTAKAEFNTFIGGSGNIGKIRLVYAASHHGAYSGGEYNPFETRNLVWLDYLKPKLVLFSSGHDLGYLHPRCVLVNKFKDRWNARNGDWRKDKLEPLKIKDSDSRPTHRLDCGLAYFSNDRRIRADETTIFPMFNTCNSGHMTVGFPNAKGKNFEIGVTHNRSCSGD